MRVVHCKKERFDVYIGRPSKWGNPFVIGRDGTREEVLEKYETWARNNSLIMNCIKDLSQDAVLGCWCKPNYDCHGDIIIKIWKELNNYT